MCSSKADDSAAPMSVDFSSFQCSFKAHPNFAFYELNLKTNFNSSTCSICTSPSAKMPGTSPRNRQVKVRE